VTQVVCAGYYRQQAREVWRKSMVSRRAKMYNPEYAHVRKATWRNRVILGARNCLARNWYLGARRSKRSAEAPSMSSVNKGKTFYKKRVAPRGPKQAGRKKRNESHNQKKKMGGGGPQWERRQGAGVRQKTAVFLDLLKTLLIPPWAGHSGVGKKIEGNQQKRGRLVWLQRNGTHQ